MRRCKTVVQILLILSVVNFAFARLAQSRVRHEARTDHMNMAEDILKVSEKWHKPLDATLVSARGRRSTVKRAQHDVHDVPETSNSETGSAKLEPDLGDKFLNKELKTEMWEDSMDTFVSGVVLSIGSLSQNQISGVLTPDR